MTIKEETEHQSVVLLLKDKIVLVWVRIVPLQAIW